MKEEKGKQVKTYSGNSVPYEANIEYLQTNEINAV